MEGFRVIAPVQVRFSDLDLLGHVNNAVYLTYTEISRLVYFQSLALELADVSGVVARVEIDYKKPVLLGQQVEVGCRVKAFGRTSFRMQYRIEADGGLAALSETVQVWLEAGRPAPLPLAFREAVQKLELTPVEE
jgi:acyl-CoA thioester hydrolase